MRYLVVGGGVAGVSCFNELARVCGAGDEVTLLSASPYVRAATNIERAGSALERFDLVELSLEALLAAAQQPQPQPLRPAGVGGGGGGALLRAVLGEVLQVDAEAGVARLAGGGAGGAGGSLAFDRLCLCTGAAPQVLLAHPLVLGLRDSASVAGLAAALAACRRALVVGNGGIALSLATEAPCLPPCELLWAVREAYLGGTFLDAAASDFIVQHVRRTRGEGALVMAAPAPAPAPAAAAVGSSASAAEGSVEQGSGAVAALFVHSGDGGSGAAGAAGAAAAASAAAASAAARPPPPPLPKRQRAPGRGGKGARAEAAQSGPPAPVAPHPASAAPLDSASQPSASEGAAAAAAATTTTAAELTAAAGAAGAAPPQPQPQPPSEQQPPQQGAAPPLHGAALGPHWAQALHSHTHGAAPAAALPPAASAAPRGARIVVETCVEVVALRGVPGTPGDAGALAGGQWLYLAQHGSGSAGGGGLQQSPPPPPPPPPPSPPPPAAGPPWPLHVLLSNGRTHGVDAVLSATGVAPVTGALPRSYARAWDGGVVVNPSMQTSASARVYAAGDCAAVAWPQALHYAAGGGGGGSGGGGAAPSPPLWFQLRTWAQARAAGAHAARCMAGAREAVEGGGGGMAFEVFAHTTGVCGLKLVLLGLFNGQGLGAAWEAAVRGSLRGAEGAGASASAAASAAPAPAPAPALDCSSPWGRVALLLRVTPGEEFVQVVVVGGRVVGALLLGDTGLEETLENLICNGTDVRVAGGEEVLDLLNPEVDIEDYFD